MTFDSKKMKSEKTFHSILEILKIIDTEDLLRRVVPFSIYIFPIIFSKIMKKQMVPPMVMTLCLTSQLIYAVITYRPFKPENTTNFISWIGQKIAEAAYQAFIGNQPVSRYRFISTFALNFSLIAALTRSTNFSQKAIAFFDLVLCQTSMLALFLNINSKLSFLLPIFAAIMINIFSLVKEYRSFKKCLDEKKKLIPIILGIIIAVIASILQYRSSRETYDDNQISVNALFPVSMNLLLIASKKVKSPPGKISKFLNRCKRCK